MTRKQIADIIWSRFDQGNEDWIKCDVAAGWILAALDDEGKGFRKTNCPQRNHEQEPLAVLVGELKALVTNGSWYPIEEVDDMGHVLPEQVYVIAVEDVNEILSRYQHIMVAEEQAQKPLAQDGVTVDLVAKVYGIENKPQGAGIPEHLARYKMI